MDARSIQPPSAAIRGREEVLHLLRAVGGLAGGVAADADLAETPRRLQDPPHYRPMGEAAAAIVVAQVRVRVDLQDADLAVVLCDQLHQRRGDAVLAAQGQQEFSFVDWRPCGVADARI